MNRSSDLASRAEMLRPVDMGKKDDSHKIKWRLIPWDAMREITRVLMFGAYEKPQKDGSKGYGPDNWRLVPDAKNRYSEALIRHVLAYWVDGETRDEDNLHHLACAGCCVLFLLALDLRGVIRADGIPVSHKE